VRALGPLRVAEFDCYGCEGPATLNHPECRACVLGRIGGEGEFEWVSIGRELRRIYTSKELSKLAGAIAAARRSGIDALLRIAGARGEGGLRAEDENALKTIFDAVARNPYNVDEKMLKEAWKFFTKSYGKRGEEIFKEIVESTEKILKTVRRGGPPHNEDYDSAFGCIAKCFFVDGLWLPPPKNARLVEEYKLPGGRGEVRVYEREHNPVLLYHLSLPEFSLPQDRLSLLYRAFRIEIEEAPGHARFARSALVRSFAEQWYVALMHMVRKGGEDITSDEIQQMAHLIANWLVYRSLEVFSHDDRITDVYVHAPPELQPVIVEHEKWGRMETGIYLTTPSLLALGEMLASRLGTAFDEVHPQLDAEIPELGMRLFLSRYPAIWPRSVEVAVRKRRSKPWTQPLFLDRGTLTPFASAVLGNLLRLGASAFVIGEMGTAKTSQVETYIPEIGPGNRIIAFQDTEELHVEDFVKFGYKLANVRVADPEHLNRQVNAFLRGGASYWLITEVRAAEAVKAALGAAARQGSQPVVASFHARSKREMYDLVVHIMDLHPAAYRYIDLIVTTARFSTPSGTVRRIVEIAEVTKNWTDVPQYAVLFADNRKKDVLEAEGILSGNRRTINRLNDFDLHQLDPEEAAKEVSLTEPEKGGSHIIPALCRRLAIEERDFLTALLCEARMKSDLLMLSRNRKSPELLELPFVSAAYNAYFSSLKRNAPDYGKVMEEWRSWLKKA
jgi:type IV secretory pathway ATPase VirB11/archaellum biosynthesis ATPase